MCRMNKMLERLKRLGSATSRLMVMQSCHHTAEGVRSGSVVWKIMPKHKPFGTDEWSPRRRNCCASANVQALTDVPAPTCCTMTCSRSCSYFLLLSIRSCEPSYFLLLDFNGVACYSVVARLHRSTAREPDKSKWRGTYSFQHANASYTTTMLINTASHGH